jgi:hypothetical protein
MCGNYALRRDRGGGRQFAGGDAAGLLDVLAPMPSWVADGGGLAAATKRPIKGVDKVGKLLSMLAEYYADVGAVQGCPVHQGAVQRYRQVRQGEAQEGRRVRRGDG